MKTALRLLSVLILVFILPSLVSAGLWATQERPARWSEAKWGSAGILPRAAQSPEAAIYVYSAMTGGMKGALASHAWIVTKEKGGEYKRYDKVGWGSSPIRRNHRAPDAYWYSNPPRLVTSVHGAEAEALIPKVEAAIESYPHGEAGGYRIYPGPNSNTFVAHVLRSVPELDAVLPADAVGRDYLPHGAFYALDEDGRDLHLSLGGLAGLSVGARSGFEVNFLGLVAGVDVAPLALKLPGFGTMAWE
ncbi:DUF3750 domain-containing protein [Peteryoungia desertarenae]|uniref:DUF3750 domain-containing protein n=1 Tax=Peteryoungia desertarenae TaxID=1813451 RepID=A0ABX6QMN2_9HYPH|nr:DUF3750 domain-containing protein [Peteryoungia desertarenae]QLF69744.1 DUF3750 domain-containing protein [Peteryoungia desertarenae]